MPMKQSEARILIIQQWNHWISMQPPDAGGPTAKDSLRFFHELQDARSSLLDFVARGDKWRVIHSWLLDAEQLSDRISLGRRNRVPAAGRVSSVCTSATRSAKTTLWNKRLGVVINLAEQVKRNGAKSKPGLD
jgi:hypothetical protein